jgi:hypothetical protein
LKPLVANLRIESLDDVPLVKDKASLQLAKEFRDACRINQIEITCTHLSLTNVRPLNSVQFDLNNRTFEVHLKLGVHDLGVLPVVVENGVAQNSAKSFAIDCTHNNDLVDYFKTLFEGNLEVELP